MLRLGTYQLREMDSVPDYAAVSQSVELVRYAGAARAAGLVNGVLQSVRRRGDTVAFPTLEADPPAFLSTWGSHPRWMVERWLERWDREDVAALVEANNRRADLYLTPVGLPVEEAIERLVAGGVAAESVEEFPRSISLGSGSDPREALRLVPGVIQDPAAARVVDFAAIEGGVILDMAAAPGGKTVGLATAADYTVAADLSIGRMSRIRSNVRRCDLEAEVGLVVGDGRQPPFRPVDSVVLDAPCTGTGTLRRHPDGRWRLTQRDIEALAELQRDLLRSAADVVKQGGTLIYSTCSLEPEENQDQVDWFLREHRGFTLDPPENFDPSMVEAGMLQILPQRHGFDGAFAARFRKEE